MRYTMLSFVMCSAQHAGRTASSRAYPSSMLSPAAQNNSRALSTKRFLCLRNARREFGLINLKERGPVQFPPRSAVQRTKAAWIHNSPFCRFATKCPELRPLPNKWEQCTDGA